MEVELKLLTFLGGVPLLLLAPLFFSHYLYQVHHLVNQDDQHLLAHAMASDFSVAWQCLSKRTVGFLVTDQTPRPETIDFVFGCFSLQGCQIFLGPSIPKWEKYSKSPQTIPNSHKLYQMAVKYSKWS
jgi:hypothetical protein